MYEIDQSGGVIYFRTWSHQESNGPLNVAIMNLGHIGDFWMSLPALQEARRLFFDARLTLVVGPWNRDLAEAMQLADEIVTIDYFGERAKNAQKAHLKAAAAEKAASQINMMDIAIDIRAPNDTRFILEAIPARHRCALAPQQSAFIDLAVAPSLLQWHKSKFYNFLAKVGLKKKATRRREKQRRMLSHCAAEACKVIHYAYDNTLMPQRSVALPSAGSPAPSGAGYISIVPFSNSKLRDWPFASYVELCRELLAHSSCDIHVVCNAKALSTTEIGQINELRRKFSSEGRLSVRDRLSRMDFFSELAAARLVISNNSGAGHISGQMGIPTLGVYTASHHPGVWGFVGPRVSILVGDVPCSACGIDFEESRCPYGVKCRSMITTEHVRSEALNMLDRFTP